MRKQRMPEKNPPSIQPKLSLEVGQLTCQSWQAGRMEVDGGSNWNLDSSNKAVDESDKESGNESLASEGSRITSTEETSIVLDVLSTSRSTGSTRAAVVMPCSPTASAIRSSCNIASEETPPDKRSTPRQQPDDCHVII
jgi:uncharacterized caspase-like protein